MNIWLVEISDFVPWIETEQRPFRCGMLAQCLAQRGHTIHWWTSTFNHQLRTHRASTSQVVRAAPNVNIHMLHARGYAKSASIQRWWHNRQVAREFRRLAPAYAESARPDIIYACIPTLEVAEQVYRFAEARRIPLSIDVRELWPDNYLTMVPEWARKGAELFLRTEYARARRILSGATAITATSDAYLNWALALAGRDRNGIDKVFPLGAPDPLASNAMDATRPVQPTLDDGRFVVVFAGTFSKLFDLETVIRAASRLKREGRLEVLFRLIGSGGEFDRVKNAAAGLVNVEFTGWLDKAAVALALSSAAAGIAPYSSDILPTLPNKPFEYMAAGLPIITCAEGELKSLLKAHEIGVHYAFGDANDLVAKCYWMAQNRTLTAEMGRRARLLFEQRFDQKIVYADMVSHLARIAFAAGPQTVAEPA